MAQTLNELRAELRKADRELGLLDGLQGSHPLSNKPRDRIQRARGLAAERVRQLEEQIAALE